MAKKKRKNEVKIKQVVDIRKDILDIKFDLELKDILRGRSLNSKVIPSACNIKNVLIHLKDRNWNVYKLKKYERSCYEAYKLDKVIGLLKDYEEKYWPEILRLNILSIYGEEIGANCVAMYLVGYVAENIGCGEAMMREYCKLVGITERDICAKAIYNTGKSDGEYLGVLKEDGKIADWDFFEKWVMG